MIEIDADIPLGEAIRPSALAHARVYQADMRTILLSALGLAGAIIVASIFGMLLPLLSLSLQGMASLLWIAGAFVGLTVALKIHAHRHMRGFLANLRKMGTPAVYQTHFRFDDDGIAVASQRSSYRAPWGSVLFVIPAPEHWLVQIDTTTLAIPRRIFAAPADEKAFLDLAARNLAPEARARSAFER
jgi:hypothetical protein